MFEGYKNTWYQTHELDGINVVRVKTFITANEGFIKRILDYMSFMVTGFCWPVSEKARCYCCHITTILLCLCWVGVVGSKKKTICV